MIMMQRLKKKSVTRAEFEFEQSAPSDREEGEGRRNVRGGQQ